MTINEYLQLKGLKTFPPSRRYSLTIEEMHRFISEYIEIIEVDRVERLTKGEPLFYTRSSDLKAVEREHLKHWSK